MSLNHLGIISVDAPSHVICGATVEYADGKDSETVKKIAYETTTNLNENDIVLGNFLADTNYISGEAYKYLKDKEITAYIPTIGSYKAYREGFSYDKENDCYIYSQGAKACI